MKFTCSKCAKAIRAPDEMAGKQGQCPSCGHIIDVPAVAPKSQPAAPAESSHAAPAGTSAPRRRPLILIGAASLLVVVAVAAVIGFVLFRSNGKVAQWRGENVMDLSGSAVTSDEFKGEKYRGTVAKGGLKLSGSGIMAFSGSISGKQVTQNEPSKLWRSVGDSFTRCRILDSDGIKLLVDGDVETMNDESLFLAPGSVIENATINRQTIPLAVPAGGAPYQLSFGETVEVDARGEIKSRTNRTR